MCSNLKCWYVQMNHSPTIQHDINLYSENVDDAELNKLFNSYTIVWHKKWPENHI